ncbi:hypothetical protein, partial [Novosphingobium colocasiae]|uniref:hypothetical protein n=1 Tax=Novosphingobium colocasiae TaxID=1256513 RepID=UPI004032C71C
PERESHLRQNGNPKSPQPLDSNQESNFEERARDVRSLIDTVRNSLTVNARQRRSPAGAP